MPILNTPEERHVISYGYKHVSTNTLMPNEILPWHLHEDHNTHFVVRGEITMTVIFQNGRRLRSMNFTAKKPWSVPAYAEYTGVAGPDGVTFVEGRSSCNSPGFRKRMAGVVNSSMPRRVDKDEGDDLEKQLAGLSLGGGDKGKDEQKMDQEKKGGQREKGRQGQNGKTDKNGKTGDIGKNGNKGKNGYKN